LLFNSSILVGADGREGGQYNKRHLVLFGERLPFEDVFPFIQRLAPLGFSCAPGQTSTVFRLSKPAVTFSSLICFEDTIALLARESVKNGARLLINQTNDAWFDGSSAAVQHMAHCVFRCIENRVPAVRSANTGVTCFIDALGRIEFFEDKGRKTCFRGFAVGGVNVPPRNMALTFYTRNGDIPFAIPCGIFAAIALAVVIRYKAKLDEY
jgi:apolipoprotein N-acyltransferase